MSTPPRSPKDDDAPARGTDVRRPNLDQTLVGIAPTVSTGAPAPPVPAVAATPVIAVPHAASDQNEPEQIDASGTAEDSLAREQPADDAMEHASGRASAGESVNALAETAPLAVPGPGPARIPFAPATVRIDARDLAPAAPGIDPLTRAQGGIGTSGPHASGVEVGSAAVQPLATRFEQVPTVRAALSEQPPASIGRPLFLEAGVGEGARQSPAHAFSRIATAKSAGRSRLRWVALAIPALVAIGFALFGDRLAGEPEGRVKFATPNAGASDPKGPGAATTGQTTMANRPSSARTVPSPGASTVAPIVGGPAATPTDAVIPAVAPRSLPPTPHVPADADPSVVTEAPTAEPSELPRLPKDKQRPASPPKAHAPAP